MEKVWRQVEMSAAAMQPTGGLGSWIPSLVALRPPRPHRVVGAVRPQV